MIETILRVLAPYTCITCSAEGDYLCDTCLRVLPAPQLCYRCSTPQAPHQACTSCVTQTDLDDCFVATSYQGAGKQLVTGLKFDRVRSAAKLIAVYLNRILPDLPLDATICALPTALPRVRTRGYDQSLLIARHLARLRGLPHRPLLARSSAVRQVGASAQQRRQQMSGAFRYKGRAQDAPRTVVLIDDVITTGSSMCAAAQELRRHGVHRIVGVAFAQSQSDD